MVEVGRLEADRWKEYRDLRLEALKSDPTAFGSSAEEESLLPESEWRKRIGTAFFAFSEGMPVGMAGFMVGSRAKTSHVADIFGVYVRPANRGKGVGKMLLEEVLREISKNRGVRKVKLTVNPEQKAALRLYEGAGFVEVGRLRGELHVGGRYYDEVIMEKRL